MDSAIKFSSRGAFVIPAPSAAVAAPSASCVVARISRYPSLGSGIATSLPSSSSSSSFASFSSSSSGSVVFQCSDAMSLWSSPTLLTPVVWIDWTSRGGGRAPRTLRSYLSRRGRAASSPSRTREALVIGGGQCSCKLEAKRGDLSSRDSSSGDNSSEISPSCSAEGKSGAQQEQQREQRGGLQWQDGFRFHGGAGGSVDIERVRVARGVERVILQDRRWLEEVLARNPEQGEEAWNWSHGGLLVAVPGVAGLNLSGPQSVLEALGVLAAIITVHEAGHFLAARLQNIHVTKFAVGFGPTLAKFQKQGIEYSLRAFPFGGFVAFPDDDPNSEFAPDDPNLLKNRPVLDRALVICAGVFANLIFAYSVLFVQTLGVGLLEREILPGVMVPEVIKKSAAARSGMQAGDVIMGVDGYQFSSKDSAVLDLVDTIKRSAGKAITLAVQRGPDLMGVQVTPDTNTDGSGRIGVQLSQNANPHRVKAANIIDALAKTNREFGRLTSTVVEGLKQILFNFEKTVDSVSGPVAIVAVGAEVARADVAGLYQFAAIVNINLAVVNLLPLPALDGGYLAFVLLEALRGGKKLPDGVEQGIMSSGVLLLLALGIVLMVRDTLNLGFVQQML